MTATALRTPVAINPLIVFQARCEARAYLVAVGEYGLHEAIDPLQEAAEQQGLIRTHGQDVIQKVMADAFHHEVRR